VGNFLGIVWKTLIFFPFLNILFLLYKVTGNSLGLAVIIIAIVSRLALTPLTKKQMDSAEKMQKLRPQLADLQKKYANNQEMLAKEQMKLYKKVGFNPLGCLGPTIIQLVFLIGVVIGSIKFMTAPDFTKNFEGIYDGVKTFVVSEQKDFSINTRFLGMDLEKNYTQLMDECDCIPLKGVLFNIPYTIITVLIGFLMVPDTYPYWVMAILTGLAQYFVTDFMQFFQGSQSKVEKKALDKKKKKGEELTQEEMQAQMFGSMNKLFPLMSVLLALGYPAVLGVYWLVQLVMGIVQYFFIDKEKSKLYFVEKYKEYKEKLVMKFGTKKIEKIG